MKTNSMIRLSKIYTLITLLLFSFNVSKLHAQGIKLEAEEGVLLGSNTIIENSAEGYSGTGYVSGFQEETDGVLLTINIETAGKYTISVGFSTPFGAKENFISINDEIADTVAFPEITGFSEVIVGDFQLSAGENTIGFHSYWGWCHFDYIKVSDIAPRGEFTYTPEFPATGDTITYDATGTFDPNGTIEAYNWDFGDGINDTGMVVKHTYTTEGIKTVTLLLTDNDGNTSQLVEQISVSRAEPYAVFSYSEEFPEPNSVINFDGSLSYDLTGTVDAWEWDFDDGTTASGEQASHTFTTEGNFNVSLTVTNNRGKTDTRNVLLYIYNSDVILRGPSLLTPLPLTNEKIELGFQVMESYTNPYDPNQIQVDAIISPTTSTDSIVVPCFYYENSYYQHGKWLIDSSLVGWRLRFSTKDAGDYTVKLKYTGNSVIYGQEYALTVQEGTKKGIVKNDAGNNQYYRHETGEPFYPMGINIGWNNITNYATILNNITANNANLFRYWHTPFAQQAIEWSDNNFYDGLGYYSQKAAGMTDSLLNLGKDIGAYMQLVIFQHGPFSENVNPIWDENPYNTANGGFVDQAEEFFYNDDCKVYTKKLLRYIVARWGYSPNIFAWEFFNEVQFTGNHPNQSSQWYDGVQQWHSEMSRYVESIDPFDHIMTTSAENDQIEDLDSIATLDVVQYHLYSENLLSSQKNLDYAFKDDLESAIINGEYGEDVTTADVPIKKQQISLWNSIMTEVPHIMWLWDNYHQEQWGKVFYYPTLFLEDEDLSKIDGLVAAVFTAANNDKSFETTGLSSDSSFYGVVYDESGGLIQEAIIDKLKLAYGYYDVTYYLSGKDETISQVDVPFIREENSLTLPTSGNDIAIKIKFKAEYTLPIALAGADQQIPLGTTTTLDGSASKEYSGLDLNYNWELVEKPASSNLVIVDETLAKFEITPDISGYYYFKLTVDNGTDFSVPDTIKIVASTQPIADAGPDVSVMPRRTVELDGTGSYDADGEALSYLWQIVSKPAGASSDILNHTSAVGLFRGDLLGEYIVTLTVDDGIQPSEPDTALVTVEDITTTNKLIDRKLSIHPNPATNELNIVLDAGSEELNKLTIYDLTGRLVYVQPISAAKNNNTYIKLNLTEINLQNGLYILQLQFNAGNINKTFIKN